MFARQIEQASVGLYNGSPQLTLNHPLVVKPNRACSSTKYIAFSYRSQCRTNSAGANGRSDSVHRHYDTDCGDSTLVIDRSFFAERLERFVQLSFLYFCGKRSADIFLDKMKTDT